MATELICDAYDIRTVQELLGHMDLSTTMIYTHVLNRGGRGVRSPADRLEWEPTSMSGGAKRVLDAFEQLPPGERDEVVVELPRRAASAPHESSSDDELLRAADDVFLELDRRES